MAGHGRHRQLMPYTSSMSSAVTTSPGAPWATILPSFITIRLVRVAEGEVEVVQDDDERVVAPSVQIAAEIEDLELVGDVQEGGGLVEEKQRGLLGQDEGEPGALALTAGELVHPAMGETRDPGGAHGRLDGGVILLRPLPEHALIGESPPADEVAHGDALRAHRALRKQAESSCDRLRGVGRDAPAIQKHSAAPWGQKSGQRAQQGGFAAGVRGR